MNTCHHECLSVCILPVHLTAWKNSSAKRFSICDKWNAKTAYSLTLLWISISVDQWLYPIFTPLLWPPNRFPVVSSSSFFFFPSPILSRCRLDVYHTCGSAVFAGLTTCCEFRMPAGLKCAAARGSLKNTGHKNSQKNRHLSTIEQLCRAISSQLRHLSPIGKKLVKQQYFLHIFSQYGELGPLTANIGSRV